MGSGLYSPPAHAIATAARSRVQDFRRSASADLSVGEFTGYAELYSRAKAIADARISAVVSPDPLHTRIAPMRGSARMPAHRGLRIQS